MVGLFLLAQSDVEVSVGACNVRQMMKKDSLFVQTRIRGWKMTSATGTKAREMAILLTNQSQYAGRLSIGAGFSLDF